MSVLPGKAFGIPSSGPRASSHEKSLSVGRLLRQRHDSTLKVTTKQTGCQLIRIGGGGGKSITCSRDPADPVPEPGPHPPIQDP
ncbi:hypothetical protein GDO78_002615 [Eleutherodactylus coqui]|uniref:Uncharacterized protein n=1 Tax=Eleutherodactylus coqui TaxID=57060 RepID=A0A8J6EZ80_ELECQ|nr:hypothetical protein GDO78_002615 [Eleutherodactylus coqui]